MSLADSENLSSARRDLPPTPPRPPARPSKGQAEEWVAAAVDGVAAEVASANDAKARGETIDPSAREITGLDREQAEALGGWLHEAEIRDVLCEGATAI